MSSYSDAFDSDEPFLQPKVTDSRPVQRSSLSNIPSSFSTMSGKLSTIAFEGELNSIIKEYLQHGDYIKSLQVFEQECTSRGKPISTATNRVKANEKSLSTQNELIRCYQYGLRTDFFKLWDKSLPQKIRNEDPVAMKLEFYLNIYFATYAVRQGSEVSNDYMNDFRKYIETRGASLSQTTEFLPYYALPFVPQPKTHPTYREIFTDSWVMELQARLDKFLSLALQSTDQPRLFELYNGTNKDAQQQFRVLQQQVVDAEKRTMQYLKKHNKVQADYHHLIGITAELVDTLEATVQGKPITAEYLQLVCSRLFSSQHAQMAQSLDLSRPGTAGEALRQSIAPQKHKRSKTPSQIAPLDFEKVKKDLATAPDRNRTLLLQALRWRLTRATSSDIRVGVLSAYITNDLLGCSKVGEHRQAVLEMLSSPSDIVKEYIARLFNAFASLNQGRSYLSLNSDLLKALMDNLRAETKDSLTRENILGALQKLSLRRNLQSAMIEEGIIRWLVDVLEDNDSLSDYTLEYSVALLMNLCLRSSGKKSCVEISQKILKTLSDLLGHENHEILPYVNGTLYSILAIGSIREDAKAMGMEEILRCFIKDGQPDMNRQLEFIIKQLNSGENPDDTPSDDEEEDEDEEDQDAMEADLDKAEALKPMNAELSGENLLSSQYPASAAPQSARRRRAADLSTDEPLQRPVTPGIRKQTEPYASLSASRAIERPPTRSGSRPNTSDETKSTERYSQRRASLPGSSTKIPRSTDGTGRRGSMQLNNSEKQQNPENKDYTTAFSSRPKIPRTPDLTGRPTSRGGITDIAPPPTFSDSLPRSRPGSGSGRNVQS
ncbi:lisH domain-containing protein ARMC9-like isoform X2 [Tubulanus polymorphus]|uniref:lisH domain-containing protein ARMC9-like isoform X2 n=1 Tax=Tubulanus polymorphus TaxID=672921 RepID=UPI003DA4058B